MGNDRQAHVADSQTLWDQLNALARHLAPMYEALGARARQWTVINVDETRWPMMGSNRIAAGHGLGHQNTDGGVLSHAPRQIRHGGRADAGRLSWDCRRGWLCGVRKTGARQSHAHTGPLLGAHETEVRRDRRSVSVDLWGRPGADWAAVRDRATRARPRSVPSLIWRATACQQQRHLWPFSVSAWR